VDFLYGFPDNQSLKINREARKTFLPGNYLPGLSQDLSPGIGSKI
jgi:hypothetical protein